MYIDPTGNTNAWLVDLAKAAGAKDSDIKWDGKTRTATITANGVTNTFKVDKYKNDQGHIVIDTNKFNDMFKTTNSFVNTSVTGSYVQCTITTITGSTPNVVSITVTNNMQKSSNSVSPRYTSVPGDNNGNITPDVNESNTKTYNYTYEDDPGRYYTDLTETLDELHVDPKSYNNFYDVRDRVYQIMKQKGCTSVTLGSIAQDMTGLHLLAIHTSWIEVYAGSQVEGLQQLGVNSSLMLTSAFAANRGVSTGWAQDVEDDYLTKSNRNNLKITAQRDTTEFNPPKVYTNSNGQITNGTYIIDKTGMDPHKTGSTSTTRSQFFFGVDAETATLDAAVYADQNSLWVNNQAKVPVTNGDIGVIGKTGQTTNWIEVTKTNTGFVHGWPCSAPNK
ncbi:MAG: hypothetical protein Q8920_09425 [Bacillota bacterium]|nr:hypothetical protein [Bacillota bacterium]